MHPILFSIGPITIHTYGLALALGALAGVWLMGRLAKSYGLDPEKPLNIAVACILAGIVGSRVVHVLLNPEAFAAQPWRVVYFWEGGLVFYGGVAGALPVGLIMARHYKLHLLKFLDCAAPALALGQAIGRLGCFSAGCCYGSASDIFCSVVFNDPHTLAPRGVSLHPAQLYTSGTLLLIMVVLLLVRKRQTFAGQLFFLYGALHGVARILLEQVRGDFRGQEVFAGLSVTGTGALVFAVFSLLMLLVLWMRRKKNSLEEPK